MSEEKIIATLNTIFSRVQREFPLIVSVGNISKRIIRNLKEKIADVYFELFSELIRASSEEKHKASSHLLRESKSRETKR
jgi:hypothetical protein